MELLLSALTLFFLEIILGIDNVIFVSILSEKLPLEKQRKARNIGMGVAMGIRLVLLAGISLIIGMTEPIAFLWGLSGKGVILIIGGLFLGISSLREIYEASEGHHELEKKSATNNFAKTIVSIVLVSFMFSFDSILTAVGLTESVAVMAFGIIGSTIIMMLFAKKVSDYITKHKSLKMLALSFLLMISLFLVLEAVHVEVPKGYIYTAMAFGLFVEVINIRTGRKKKGIELPSIPIKNSAPDDNRDKIYHILNFQTKEVLASSSDEKKLEKVFISDEYKDRPVDFIWSYDCEPIRNKNFKK